MLERRKPETIPTLRILPEYAAEGRRAAWYEDMKAVLQVPWAGVLILAWTAHPTFFGTLWRSIRPICLSRPFVALAAEARALVETRVADLAPPPIASRLRALGYGDREIEEIRALNEVFSHGNQLYVVLATIARLLLEGEELSDRGEATPHEGRHAPDVAVSLALMEAHHADAPTRALYEDVKATLGLPFVNTDYRAFARWPSYWAEAWPDLKAAVGHADYEAINADYHALLCRGVLEGLPNPEGLTAAALREAAAADAPLDTLIDEVRLFQWLIPGLAINVAFLRAQLIER